MQGWCNKSLGELKGGRSLSIDKIPELVVGERETAWGDTVSVKGIGAILHTGNARARL